LYASTPTQLNKLGMDYEEMAQPFGFLSRMPTVLGDETLHAGGVECEAVTKVTFVMMPFLKEHAGFSNFVSI
jgi:hypothetical protein